jgi:hypothetical protein
MSDNVVFTDSQATWESDVGGAHSSFDNITSNYAADSTTLVGGESVTYPSSDVLNVTETTTTPWETWSGGYTGEVVWDKTATSVTINLAGVSAFGFQVEPEQFQTESITVTLSDGQSITDDVNGFQGAQFFGFVGTGITSITITDNSDDTFAFGNFYYEPALGLDSSSINAIASQASSVAQQYGFVGAYLNPHNKGADILNSTLASDITNAGLQIVSLYQTHNMADASWFVLNAENGTLENKAEKIGELAYTDAMLDGQGAWPGSAIYFGIDFNPGKAVPGFPNETPKTLLADVATFFKGIALGFQKAANGVVEFTVGVYGAGETDMTIVGSGLAKYSWLAGSPDWLGFKQDTTWNIKQMVNAGSVNGLVVDTDKTTGYYFGQWGPTPGVNT